MRLIKKILIGVVISITSIAALFAYARYIEPNRIIINKVSMQSTTETKPEIGQLKLVFFSDTHFGKDYNQTKIEKIVQKINE